MACARSRGLLISCRGEREIPCLRGTINLFRPAPDLGRSGRICTVGIAANHGHDTNSTCCEHAPGPVRAVAVVLCATSPEWLYGVDDG